MNHPASPVAVPPVIEHLAPVGLDELNAVAALQRRVDRKYIVSVEQASLILSGVNASARVLEVDGRRLFEYESTYFDTPHLSSYRASAHRRPNRFKIRTRTYVDSGECWIEVKVRDRRRHTVKHRAPHSPSDHARITTSAADFVDGIVGIDTLNSELQPTLLTRYRRATLMIGSSRVTLDFGVTCELLDAPGSRSPQRALLADRVILETKSVGGCGPLDRALWAAQIRPATISKYCTGLAALCPSLPANKWHRTLQRHPLVTS